MSNHCVFSFSFSFSFFLDMVEHADGFAEVFPEHKYLIVELLQKGGHIVGMTGDGVNDAPALKRADVGIAVQGATGAASAAADIVLTDSGLSTIIMGINIAREIFQRMKNYCIYRISATIQILFFFLMSIIVFDFQLPVFVIVLISIINDGTIITIAYDNVKVSPRPEKWNLPVVCGVALCLGFVSVLFTFMMLYLSLPRDPHNMNLICNTGLSLNVTLQKTCQSYLNIGFDLPVLEIDQVQALIYLQLSLSGQLTVFSARTRSWFFTRAPGQPLVVAFCIAQICSTLLAIYPLGELQPMLGLACSGLQGVCEPGSYTINASDGWNYAGFVWCYCLIVFVIQDCVKVTAYHILDYQDTIVNERKQAAIRLQRENRLKEDEVRPRRDPASSYEKAQMRVNMERRSRSRGSDLMYTNLNNSGGLALGGGVSTEVMSAGSLSAANIPEVLQGLLRRVSALEEELSVYRSRSQENENSPLRTSKKGSKKNHTKIQRVTLEH